MHAESRHCALRAPTVFFRADKKRIRTENTVIDKDEDSAGRGLYKIGDPRGRDAVRASSIAIVRGVHLPAPKLAHGFGKS